MSDRIDLQFYALDACIDFILAFGGVSRQMPITDEHRAILREKSSRASAIFDAIREDLLTGVKSFHGVRFWLVGDTLWRESTYSAIYQYVKDHNGYVQRYEYLRVSSFVSPPSS